MNEEESLALFAQGRDAWNAWTGKMSTEREALQAAGTWIAGRDEAEWNDATRAWHEAAKADFGEHQFKESADFSGFVFPDHAWFSEATFSGDARFNEAVFLGDAWFSEATFSGDARFNEAVFSDIVWFNKATFSDGAWFSEAAFSGDAMFNETTFSGDAIFSEATFSGDAWFLQAVFGGFALFADTRFEKVADFRAINGKSFFSLNGATFLAVPHFIQAHFAEAPRLDDSRIQPPRFEGPIRAKVKNYFKGDPNLSARWRALKRLATQGHDHMHELEFFKNERVTGRGSMYRRWQLVFWVDVFYGWLSNFGRSIGRPLILWAASALAFAPLYLGAHFDRAGKSLSVVGWIIDRFVIQPFGTVVAPPLHCLAGSGDPWHAALWISARKALLFFGLDSSDKLTQHYACLYGVIPPATSGQLPAGVYLDVPNSVIAFGIAQHIISAVLLFLLLLAIRNHFRIR